MPGAIADDVLYSRPRRDGPNVREARRAAGQRAQAYPPGPHDFVRLSCLRGSCNYNLAGIHSQLRDLADSRIMRIPGLQSMYAPGMHRQKFTGPLSSCGQ
jgi:hypothetical protein